MRKNSKYLVYLLAISAIAIVVLLFVIKDNIDKENKVFKQSQTAIIEVDEDQQVSHYVTSSDVKGVDVIWVPGETTSFNKPKIIQATCPPNYKVVHCAQVNKTLDTEGNLKQLTRYLSLFFEINKQGGKSYMFATNNNCISYDYIPEISNNDSWQIYAECVRDDGNTNIHWVPGEISYFDKKDFLHNGIVAHCPSGYKAINCGFVDLDNPEMYGTEALYFISGKNFEDSGLITITAKNDDSCAAYSYIPREHNKHRYQIYAECIRNDDADLKWVLGRSTKSGDEEQICADCPYGYKVVDCAQIIDGSIRLNEASSKKVYNTIDVLENKCYAPKSDYYDFDLYAKCVKDVQK